MVPGYEWIFVLSYATMVLGVLMLLYEAYVVVRERRARSGPRAAARATGSAPRLKMRPRVRHYGGERRSPPVSR